ncbi:MFS transporter [Legionella spiritensis]|uniref:Lysosomal dipeptide transporter MFSD1 n=1 Tax=Legionella spiritensis TaxID=452 RepID=A0A0W0YW82_LEGSP|nr:MFS transporter [Legionella spiritensis]KTD61129.1 major facilitator family transporter [Legionella spiritensis]SNV45084.1 major facilitator family transporter [Legionella spiritensis]
MAKDKTKHKGLVFSWLVCLLAAVFYSYDFLLRVMPSVMIHPLMADFGVNATQIGLLSACYYYAYTPLQLPSGAVMDKFSPRWVLGFSALLCAFGTMIFAHTNQLWVAYLARAMMGIGSAFAFVGALKLAALWLPKRQFALYSGIVTAMGTLGAMVTDTTLSHMVAGLGWRNTAYVSALVGFLLALSLIIVIRDKPVNATPATPGDYYSWTSIVRRLLGLFGSWRFWINSLVGTFLFLPVSVFASLWGVAFIAERFHINPAHAASITSLIFLGTALSGPFFGWFSEKIRSRKIPLFIGGVGVFVCSGLLIYVDSVTYWLAYSLLLLLGMSVGPQVLTFAVAKDIGPPGSTGLSTAVTNFIITIGAAVFQPLIGYFLEKNWDGTLTVKHTPYFSVADYRNAFLLFMAALALSSLLTWFIPRTLHAVRKS